MPKPDAKNIRRTVTLSVKSMASIAGEAEEEAEPDARRFLLGTAKRSLDEAFGATDKPAEKDKKKKKNDKKKDKSKKKRKGKKSSSSSDSSSDEESESEPDQEDFTDAAATFGLGKRDMARAMDATTLIDLDARPTALVLANVTPLVIANDIFEMGGELAASLNLNKMKASDVQASAPSQMKTAGTVWKRRMGLLAQHLTGRPASSIRLCAAKSLGDCSAVLRGLYKRKYPGGKDAWNKALDGMLKDAREVLLLAASDDLKKQMQQGEKPKKPEKNPKVAPTSKGSRVNRKDEPDPELSENEKEESIPSPSGAPYVGSPSEQEEEDDDNDVFSGGFAVATEKATGLDALLEKVTPKIKSVVEMFDKAVLETLPADLSELSSCPGCTLADFSYWMLCLEKEALTEMDHFKLGALSTNLGPGKGFFMKMSLRARKVFDEWAAKIPGVVAARRLH
ncbi:SCN10A [Symbiodinium sp. CCMP2592]|nr:SCN10A [Symbiodinium sp. CCMP2592]